MVKKWNKTHSSKIVQFNVNDWVLVKDRMKQIKRTRSTQGLYSKCAQILKIYPRNGQAQIKWGVSGGFLERHIPYSICNWPLRLFKKKIPNSDLKSYEVKY